MVKIHSIYDKPASEGVSFSEDSLTHQSFKDECDINNIVRRSKTTGFLVDPSSVNSARVAEFKDIPSVSFIEAQAFIQDAYDMFDSLPASVRERFDNDPSELLDFIESDDNREECIRLGLLRDEDFSSQRSTATAATAEGVNESESGV